MGTILTSEAQCRDCYKCIRYCPVKPLLKEGQAWVVEEKCIWCGQCMWSVPNGRKARSRKGLWWKILGRGGAGCCLSSPSYLATAFTSTPWKLVAALKTMGVFRWRRPSWGKTGGRRSMVDYYGSKTANSHYQLLSGGG